MAVPARADDAAGDSPRGEMWPEEDEAILLPSPLLFRTAMPSGSVPFATTLIPLPFLLLMGEGETVRGGDLASVILPCKMEASPRFGGESDALGEPLINLGATTTLLGGDKATSDSAVVSAWRALCGETVVF